MLTRPMRWLGKETNNRAMMGLLAIFTAVGVAVGSAVTFVANRIAPVVSPSFAASEFGEGYRRGRREAELETSLIAAEHTIRALQARIEIVEKFRNMSEEEVRKYIEANDDFRRE